MGRKDSEAKESEKKKSGRWGPWPFSGEQSYEPCCTVGSCRARAGRTQQRGESEQGESVSEPDPEEERVDGRLCAKGGLGEAGRARRPGRKQRVRCRRLGAGAGRTDRFSSDGYNVLGGIINLPK